MLHTARGHAARPVPNAPVHARCRRQERCGALPAWTRHCVPAEATERGAAATHVWPPDHHGVWRMSYGPLPEWACGSSGGCPGVTWHARVTDVNDDRHRQDFTHSRHSFIHGLLRARSACENPCNCPCQADQLPPNLPDLPATIQRRVRTCAPPGLRQPCRADACGIRRPDRTRPSAPATGRTGPPCRGCDRASRLRRTWTLPGTG